jgi:small subunit ribosomal protein S5
MQTKQMSFVEPDGLDLEDRWVKINRCATVVKGGRRFSFSALVVVGNAQGVVGYGFGKAKEVPFAHEKAVKDARKRLIRVPLVGATIPHEVVGRFGATKVFLGPARPGTGVTAGPAVRAMLEVAGIHDILTKTYGSCNPVNVVRATLDGLLQLRTREEQASLRGVEI